MTRLDRHLAVSVDPYLPAALIAAPHLRPIHAVAGRLPGAVSEFFGFESRLAEPEPRVDFLVSVKAETGGREVLAGLDPSAPELDPGLLADPVWQRLRGFARAWAAPGSELDRRVQNLWCEFDLNGGDAPPTAPSVFLGSDAVHGEHAADRAAWLADEALGVLRGAPLDPALRGRFVAAAAALPAGAAVFQTGLMLGRPGGEGMLRLCVRGLTRAGARTYLERVGWPAGGAPAEELLDEAFGRADSVDLDLDLTPEPAPKLGLECSFIAGPPQAYRLPAFLDWLAARGLCTEGKRRGLLAWTRALHQRQFPHAWPPELATRARGLGGGTVSMYVRWVYHIKLVFQPGRALEAKAYLAVRQAWADRALIDAALRAGARDATPSAP